MHVFTILPNDHHTFKYHPLACRRSVLLNCRILGWQADALTTLPVPQNAARGSIGDDVYCVCSSDKLVKSKP